MVKLLVDRMAYALIGAVLGAVIGAVLWFLYDFGGSLRLSAPVAHFGVRQWSLYAAAAFGFIGLLFGPAVGSAAGSTSNEIYRFETEQETSAEVPRWVVVLVLAVVAYAVWRFVK